MIPYVFDRSRREADERCRRARWWGYEYLGQGLEREQRQLELETGSAVHELLDALGKDTPLEDAIVTTLDSYRSTMAAGGLVVTEATPLEEVIEEQCALIEALGRGWASVRKPVIASHYRLVESEREYSVPMPDGGTFMMRLDRLERRITDNALVLRDFKTAATPDAKWRQAFRYNMQAMSMAYAVEQVHGEKVSGVIFEGLAKGYRAEYPKGSGRRQQSSPLIYGWRRPGAPASPPLDMGTAESWASRYEWQCTAEHKMGNGRRCEGNKGHKLSGYYKAAVWREYPGGVKEWVDYLLATDRALVEEQFIELPPIMRSEWELQEWLDSSSAREAQIASDAQHINLMIADGLVSPEQELRVLFPKQTNGGRNCAYCQFEPLCWQGQSPEGAGFSPRMSNHPQEDGLKVLEETTL